jgi:TnpA family transposase
MTRALLFQMSSFSDDIFQVFDAEVGEGCGAFAIRPETYKAALAKIIDAHHALPIADIWGDGTTSSSDRQFFRSGKRGDAAGDVNARYGVDPGVGFYTSGSCPRRATRRHTGWTA